MRLTSLVAAAAVMFGAGVAAASETQYGYDALGRLRKADQVSGVIHAYRLGYDRAGNRVSQVVEGSANGSAADVIVTRLGSGFAVIPFERQ